MITWLEYWTTYLCKVMKQILLFEPNQVTAWLMQQTSDILTYADSGCWMSPLRKHAYSNILKILPPKNENFQIKNSDIFHVSAQNIDCGYSLELPHRGGSNEYT